MQEEVPPRRGWGRPGAGVAGPGRSRLRGSLWKEGGSHGVCVRLNGFRASAARGRSGEAWSRSDTCARLRRRSLLGGPGGGEEERGGGVCVAGGRGLRSGPLPLQLLRVSSRRPSFLPSSGGVNFRRSGVGKPLVGPFAISLEASSGSQASSRQGDRSGSRAGGNDRVNRARGPAGRGGDAWGGCGEPRPPSSAGPLEAPGPPLASPPDPPDPPDPPRLAGPGGQSSAPGGVARSVRPASEAEPGWPRHVCALGGPGAPAGLAGLGAGRARRDSGSLARWAAPRSASGSPRTWAAHLPRARAGPAGVAGGLAASSRPSQRLAASSRPSQRLAALGAGGARAPRRNVGEVNASNGKGSAQQDVALNWAESEFPAPRRQPALQLRGGVLAEAEARPPSSVQLRAEQRPRSGRGEGWAPRLHGVPFAPRRGAAGQPAPLRLSCYPNTSKQSGPFAGAGRGAGPGARAGRGARAAAAAAAGRPPARRGGGVATKAPGSGRRAARGGTRAGTELGALGWPPEGEGDGPARGQAPTPAGVRRRLAGALGSRRALSAHRGSLYAFHVHRPRRRRGSALGVFFVVFLFFVLCLCGSRCSRECARLPGPRAERDVGPARTPRPAPAPRPAARSGCERRGAPDLPAEGVSAARPSGFSTGAPHPPTHPPR